MVTTPSSQLMAERLHSTFLPMLHGQAHVWLHFEEITNKNMLAQGKVC